MKLEFGKIFQYNVVLTVPFILRNQTGLCKVMLKGKNYK
jgi:hypothetical protein